MSTNTIFSTCVIELFMLLSKGVVKVTHTQLVSAPGLTGHCEREIVPLSMEPASLNIQIESTILKQVNQFKYLP